MPATCPSCSTPVEREEDVVAAYCPNVGCPGRRLEGLVHFASRGAMDIRGLSYARIEQLIEAGLVRDAADLYLLSTDQLVLIERFAEKSAAQLVVAIEDSKLQPLSRLLNGLGIRHVGTGAAQLLARHFGSMRALMDASDDEILAVRGIGGTIAHAVTSYFGNAAGRNLVDRLERLGVNMSEAQAAGSGGALVGATVVLTGTLPTLTRPQATERIERAGGRITSSVSKTTTFVVAGESAGGKLEKARALGVEIIDEAELLRRLGPDK
jgi:DNA ligase (NAD+)